MKNDKGLYLGCKLLRKLHIKPKKMCNLGRFLGVKKHLILLLRHNRITYIGGKGDTKHRKAWLS